jgi:hypothetical protein
MGDVYFTTNPADFSKLEGLYVSERKPTGFIRDRDLSTIGFAGSCVRGPDDPQTITSVGTFLDVYGGRDYGSGGALISEVWKALINKPFGTIVVRRVRAADAVKASFTLEAAAGGAGAQIARIDASSVGLWGANVMWKVEAATNADATMWNLRIRYLGKEVLYENLNTQATFDNLSLKVGTDIARYVDVVKLANGRPVNSAPGVDGADANGYTTLGQVVAAFVSVAGSEGTPVVGDYNSGVNDLAVYPGIAAVLVPGVVVGSAATFHANLVTLAAAVSDRVFLTWSQVHGQSVATEVANVAAQITTRTDRIVWCYNSAYTIDPELSTEVQTAPHVWLASILSQTDIDVHAGSFATLAFLAGITRVTNTALSRADLISLKNAGISTLERNVDGFQFRSVVTTNLNPGLTELTRRRMADFLQLSASDRLRNYVKAKNTPEVRATMAGELTAFSEGLRARGRVIEEYQIEQESVNTTPQRAKGEEHLLWRVKLIGHVLSLVLETDIGTGTVIAT